MKKTGPLVIIGGAEDKKGDRLILREFVELAGGSAAKIVIMTVATELSEETAAEYTAVFKHIIGPTAHITSMGIKNRDEANDAQNVAILQEATGVFFTGGDQFRIIRLIGGTKIDTTLHNCHENGLVLAGTSAGASMISSNMIIQGPAKSTAKIGMTKLGVGMGFLPGVIIDQHFAQRGRINRLLSAIARYPHSLGIGIDENTALIVDGHCCRVVGEGSVTVLDAGEVSIGIPSKEDDEDENLGICNVKLHLLPAGQGFNLRNRAPIFTQNQ